MKELYCVYDVVAKEAFPPFVANNVDVAMRIFTDGIAKQNLNSADYDLYFLGKYDVISPSIIDVVCQCVDLKVKKDGDLDG